LQKLLFMVSARQRAAPPKPRGGHMALGGRGAKPVEDARRP
jgi:hypothetical protein